MAIIGIDTLFGSCQNLDEFAQKVYQGIQINAELEDFEIDAFYFKIPPHDLENLDPQQLLLLKVSDRALKNANLKFIKKIALVTLSSQNNEQTKRFITDKLAKLWKVNFLSYSENCLINALEKAQILLADPEIDLVVVSAIDIINNKGAGAIVLKQYENAKENDVPIYAVINSVQDFWEQTEIEIGYLEIAGIENKGKIQKIIQSYRGKNSRLNCAISHNLSEIASLIKTALCLARRYIPATSNWLRSQKLEILQDSPFYIANESRPWFLATGQTKRTAAINTLADDGSFKQIILSEDITQKHRSNSYLQQSSPYLFAIAGNNQTDLEAQLDTLEQKLKNNTSLTVIASQTFAIFQQFSQATYTLAIVAPDPEKLSQEIGRSRQGLKQAFAKGKPWKSPLGSYFTPKPLGDRGAIAFIYPGAFNSYLGMGKDLFYLFPSLYDRCNRLSSHPGEFLRERQLYPRSLQQLSKRELEDLETQLMETPLAMLETGTGFAVLFTQIMREYFRIKPQAAFGYSMGESTMMYALDVWSNTDYGSHFIHSSELFRTRLTGSQKAVLDYWGLSPHHSNKDLWTSYVLMTSATTVREYLKKVNQVYLTHINTPTEVVIAGDPQQCRQVIEAINCDYFPSPSNFILHCEAMASEYPEFVRLNSVPISHQPEIAFYSSASYAPVSLNSQAIPHHLAKGVCQELNFPKLIDRAWEDGARIFIELGSGGTCCRWISETLKHQDHVAMCISRRGGDDFAGIVKVLAQLVSHRVSLDLSPLYSPLPATPTPQKSLIKTIFWKSEVNNLPISPSPRPPVSSPLLPLNSEAILEATNGKIARVFGKEYESIDSYARRVRMPSPPFLFVSRVTKLEGKQGDYKSGFIQTEYDIPENAWYSVDGQIPLSICAEAGHGLLLLLSYLGSDFESQGKRSFRLLDITATFFDEQPEVIKTLRYDVKITSHVKTTESLLIFFTGECWIDDKLWMKLSEGCAGLFSDEELVLGQGIVISDREKKARTKINPQSFQPLLASQKSAFNREDLLHLVRGDLAACFGNGYQQNSLNSSLRLPPQKLLMFDKVIAIDPQGGMAGKGLILASKSVEAKDWYFLCHFKNDPTMPGNLMIEGGVQLLQFYILFLGLQTLTKDARFQVIPNRPQVTRFRGQVTPTSGILFYQLEIIEIEFNPKPFVLANVNVIFDDKTIATIKNLGLQLSEKKLHLSPENISEPTLTKKIINSSIAVQTQDLKKTETIPILFNSEHLKELAQGAIVNCLGSEFEIYENRHCVRIPNQDFCLISRVLNLEGQRHNFKENSSLTTEYDVEQNTWFYQDNSSPYLPYCTYIEIAGQPCIFLGVYLGTTLLFPEEDLYFRNLDGWSKIIKDIDVKGKVITDKVRLISSTAIKGAILQKFEFQLSCDREVFYQGEMVFGYFSHQVLANQVGLDSGQIVRPWHEENQITYLAKINLDLNDTLIHQKFYRSQPNQPYYHLASNKLDFLDEVLIIELGGNNQKGYIYATKNLSKEDWYFPYHFYQDPVMPGALGIEAILQAMQVYALQVNLGKQFKSPRFGQVLNHKISWKYRGQITPENKKMSLEIHISAIEFETDQVKIIGDASLWKEDLRIYEVKDIAICLLES